MHAKLPILYLTQTTLIFKNLENIEKVERKNTWSVENVLAKYLKETLNLF